MRNYLALVGASKTDDPHRFLLATFNIDYILGFANAGGIKRALSNLSIPEATTTERENERRMDSVYNRIVASIGAQTQETKKYAFRALSWIGYATRTLTIQELLVAISVEANQYQLDDSDAFRCEDLLDICKGLVIADGQHVRLVHISARNYLDRHQVIPEDAGESYRAIACSTYLSFDQFKELHSSYSFNGPERSFPFLDYAADNFTFHLSKVERRQYPETTSAVMKLLGDQGHRRAYCAVNKTIQMQLDIPRLNLACVIGYEDAVRTILEEGDVDVNAKDSTIGLTPLSWAVLMGHEPVIRRLLGDGRIDRDWKDSTGSTALWLAIRSKNTEILGLFLENGIELNFTFATMVRKSNYGIKKCYKRLKLPSFVTIECR